MHKVFFDERLFVISDNFDQCFTQINGMACKVNNSDDMHRLIKYFKSAGQASSLWVYYPDVDKAFKWFCDYFTIVEAAGGLVRNKKNDYLLIYRFNHWDLPKGKCEKGESPEETALREVEEECSLSHLNLYDHIINTYHTYSIGGQPHLKKTYWYSMKYNGHADPKPQHEEAIEQATWVSADQIDEYMPLMYRSIVGVFDHRKDD